jgi:hypothetical protein
MKKRLAFCVLIFITMLAVGVAAFQTMQAKRANDRVEKLYQSAMLETVDYMGSMAVKLEKVLITEDIGNNVLLLSQISNQAGAAQKNLGMLPLSHEAAAPLQRFCAQTGEYAQALSRKLADGERLDETEAAQVAALLNQCTLLMGQLFFSADEMESRGLLFMNDKSVFYENPAADSRPLESIGDKDNGMDYPTLIYDGAFSDGRHRGEAKALPDMLITKEQAIEAARAFVGEEGIKSAEEAAGQEGGIPCYGVRIVKNDVELILQITKKGGKVLLMMPEHAAFEALLTLEEARAGAALFLQSRGFNEMAANYYQVYGGLAVINFTSVQDGIVLYPDMVKVQIRLDTAEVVGIEANSYWMNHALRQLEAARITEQEAREKVSSRLQISDVRLCVIPHMGGEKLCYEMAGQYSDSDYLVYIDAMTGKEVQMLKIISVEDGVMTL